MVDVGCAATDRSPPLFLNAGTVEEPGGSELVIHPPKFTLLAPGARLPMCEARCARRRPFLSYTPRRDSWGSHGSGVAGCRRQPGRGRPGVSARHHSHGGGHATSVAIKGVRDGLELVS